MRDEDIKYINELEERVQELEIQLSISTNNMKQLQKEKDEWKDTAKSYYMTNQELAEQNKRYREALEQIANSRVTIADGVGNIRIAQRALRGETDEC